MLLQEISACSDRSGSGVGPVAGRPVIHNPGAIEECVFNDPNGCKGPATSTSELVRCRCCTKKNSSAVAIRTGMDSICFVQSN